MKTDAGKQNAQRPGWTLSYYIERLTSIVPRATRKCKGGVAK